MSEFTKDKPKNNNLLRSYIKFLIPSIIGVLLFMTPIKINGDMTIPVAYFSKLVQELLKNYLPLINTVIITVSLILTLVTKLFKPKFIIKNEYLNKLFNISTIWFLIRLFGAIFVICTYFKLGSSIIYSDDTGGLLLNSLLSVLFAVFLFAGLFLPLILDFGLLEFFGTLLTKIMRPLFNLPGRSSVDCIASWLGDGTIGVLLTSKQYEDGFYTAREASIIGTSFSAVSITFSLVVLSQVGLQNMFLPFYLTVTFAGIVAALLTPRIPPLSRKPDTYFNNKKSATSEIIPSGYSSFTWGLKQATEKADKNNDVKKFFGDGFKNVFDMWLGVTPVVMALGTLALVIATYTNIFQWLGTPFIPFLKLLHIPEAKAASSTLVVGFADMFLPSVIAAGAVKSELTRFIIAAVSVTQLIYMSEVGGLLIGSKIPVNFKELFIIFLERTIITLPIITIIAHIIF
ncbi:MULTISPECIES: YjiH family protein [Clostridium]|uniref:Membrane protein n=1 Tax=Clostridium novyi (strain NT) TaxID=386415 RepID=A0PZU9_CLONN|nr:MULTISPECIES: YjiH family protein [Clostridium]ABK61887.1 membrane protein [Clostridium novyi NT]KEH87241.1 membrane protein [Clostridium novyi A str. BKT29909]KEH88397.1 membrane protein [Clostridium novyi A str. NCTC 538]KEH88740.1 membrane protein [Clostridium novyi A str. 4540]KEH94364.1 membrane protein [Clostridium botulinum C/D str. It1]